MRRREDLASGTYDKVDGKGFYLWRRAGSSR